MTVLQIVKTSEGAIWAYQQALGLSKIGYTIITVCPRVSGRSAQMYNDSGLKIIESNFSLPVLKPWEFFSRITSIRKILSEVNPDIIHTHFVTNTIMLRLALKKSDIPRVFQVPGPLHLESFTSRFIELHISTKNDFWIGACKKTCSLYKSYGVPADHVYLGYYGGYGGNTCDEYEADSGILHKEYNIPRSTKIVSMISYFYKPKRYLGQSRGIKGHEDFIDAMSVVCNQKQNVVGMVIGGAWDKSEKYETRVKAYAEKVAPGKIFFTGMRSDLKKVYREIKVAVHPSHSENLGGAAESLAAAVPTISTNVGGFPDIVINNETGYTVPPKNPVALSEAIVKALSDEKAIYQMAENGRSLVRTLLDIDVCVHNIDMIYKDIINKQRRELPNG
jgi:glycosyltransferase involved in cell wall biosynthesis